MGKTLFVAGTGTDVGKTYIAGLMVKALRRAGADAAYFKAAMSGNERDASGRLIPGDALRVRTAAGIRQPLQEMCPYVYEPAYSPHLAARLAGNPVDLATVRRCFAAVCEQYAYVTMEGAGGILCPLRCDEAALWQEEVIRALGLSCVIVSGAGLGAINAAGLTAAYMKARGIRVPGLIFNRFHPGDAVEEDNVRMIAALTGLKVLACVPCGAEHLPMDAAALMALYA